jgi:hypothetical protein
VTDDPVIVACLLMGLFGLVICLVSVPFLVRDWVDRRAEAKARAAAAGDLLVLARTLPGVVVEYETP